jgi:hypothetical protein
METLSLIGIRKLLKKHGWKSNYLLLNPQSDKVQSALEWAIDYLRGFREDDAHAWECPDCRAVHNDRPDHQTCFRADAQFADLIHVRKTRSGDYIEV